MVGEILKTLQKLNTGAARPLKQDDVRGQTGLGSLYFRGERITQDYAKRLDFWYGKSADQGYADAQYDTGYMYYYGYGVQQDRVQAHDFCFSELLTGATKMRSGHLNMFQKRDFNRPARSLRGLQ